MSGGGLFGAFAQRFGSAIDWVVGRAWIDVVSGGMEVLMPPVPDSTLKRLAFVMLLTASAHCLQEATKEAILNIEQRSNRQRMIDVAMQKANVKSLLRK